MKIENIKEISILAKQKGFVPKIFSTIWTFDSYNGIKDYPMITNMCDYLLLCEIQFWLRNVHNIILEISIQKPITDQRYYSVLISGNIKNYNLNEIIKYFKSYELSLEDGVLKTLKVLPNIDLINDKNK